MKLTIIVPVYNQEDLILKALESIPKREDIEVIVIDDGSTDKTLAKVMKFQKHNPINIIHLEENKGLGNAKNVGYNNATGEYINQLDSDDYLYTEEYEKVIDELDGTDIVYMDLQRNDGSVLNFNEESSKEMGSGCARFIRREFLGDLRCQDVRWAEDWFLSHELKEKGATEKYTGIVGYHYNYPRKGSLCDQAINGMYEIPR